MTEWVEQALAFGFSHAALLDASTLELRHEVRDMCAADKCHAYGKSWVCPPACGSIAENSVRLKPFTKGLIVQTTAQMEDDFDVETMQEAEVRQKQLFEGFRAVLRGKYPNMLPLTSGTCEICPTCTYPDAPCRHPKDATPSMEAFCLLVSDVCASNGLGYYYGPQTITYTGCYLLV